jgi:hypothetical protein
VAERRDIVDHILAQTENLSTTSQVYVAAREASSPLANEVSPLPLPPGGAGRGQHGEVVV